MSQSEPETDLISWLEQQWDKAVKDSETPDGELLEKYTFYTETARNHHQYKLDSRNPLRLFESILAYNKVKVTDR